MRTCFSLAIVIIAQTAFAVKPQYAHTAAESRAVLIEYCREECEENSAKPRLPYRETFQRALTGDFRALHVIFSSPDYHTNDMRWSEMPWHILHVLGDRRFAEFALSRPRSELSEIVSSVTPGDDAMNYFRTRFPRTYQIWKREGPFQPEPEMPGFDYRVRHLAQALAADPRFSSVRLRKRGTILVVDAPASLSPGDRAALRHLTQHYLGKKGKLVIGR
ncbi:MAG: hypothetical protein ABIR71_09405 [Chthoniobacterales bacterium]